MVQAAVLQVAALSDAELVAAVAAVVRQPRVAPADSFVLHAPLELTARAALLPHVAPQARAAARRQIAAIASEFEAFGPGTAPPPHRDLTSLAEAAARLGAAITAGDLDEVDATASWLGERATGDDLGSLLAEIILPSLAAAAHGSIFLFHLPRVAPRGEITAELLRPLARELARQPEWRLRWQDAREPTNPQPADALFEAIAATPQLGVPGSDFIYPLMSQVERGGTAATLLSAATQPADFDASARATLRAAALSMLQEPGDFAPYGWSHCLTLPQAALAVARWSSDPTAALAIAATYVVGFRAALARNGLDPAWAPPETTRDLSTALEQEPNEAAAAVWHAAGREIPEITRTLATRAAVHHDAHLVKYTLACLDAAAWDRNSAHVYLAAAASLHGWWTAVDRATPAAAGASA